MRFARDREVRVNMTRDTAEKVANVTIGAAVIALAYVVVKTPPLRRLAAGLAFTALTGAVPAWFSRELREAWVASNHGETFPLVGRRR
jgi:hypothetical protein